MRIGFFTLNAYDMLTSGSKDGAVGGAQLQQILIGKELANRGHDVYFIEYNAESKKECTIDDISIILKTKPTGTEVTRAFTVFQGTREALDRISPDVCYRRSLDFEILPLTLYDLFTDIRFIYGVAHDDELSEEPRKFSTGIKNTRAYRWINRQALSSASAVIAQNSTQYQLAAERLNTEIHQIPNCYETEMAKPIDWAFESPVVFWAARFQSWKQPEIVAEIAADLPEITFVMAGGPGEAALFSKLQQQADTLDNLKLLGHIPFSEIDSYFAAADLFLNTSTEEGFPNTFLQAWANQTPVVSLQVDPNNILSSQNIGFVADGSVDRLREKIKEFCTDPNGITESGQRGREYLRENHSVEAITDQYERVFFGV